MFITLVAAVSSLGGSLSVMKYLPVGYTICLPSNMPACLHIPVLTNSHTDKTRPYLPQPLNQKVLTFFLSSQGVVRCPPFLLLSFFLIL